MTVIELKSSVNTKVELSAASLSLKTDFSGYLVMGRIARYRALFPAILAAQQPALCTRRNS